MLYNERVKVNPNIFRAYDIRGVYGRDFDAEFAQRLGSRVAAWLGTGAIVIGRDARASSDALAYAAIDGAMHAGASVFDVGVLSSPQFYWAVRSLGARGGVMVTASHNSGGHNGFKVVVRRGDVVEVVGGHHLRQIYDSQEHQHRIGGALEYRDVAADYAAAIAYAAKWHGGTELRISVDAPDSVRRVLERLGPIAPDDGFAARFDADGDRVAFFSDGAQIPADFIFLLLTEQLGLKPVVCDVRFSRTVRARLDGRGIPYSVSKVGRLYMTQAMHESGAAFGGETSGHYYWREFGGMEAPELTLLRVYAVVQQSGRTLSELISPYRVLFKSDEIAIPVRDQKHAAALMRAIALHFPDGRHAHIDGLTVEYPDWWFNIRASNTEPLMRLTVEADTAQKLSEKSHLLLNILEVRASD